MHSKPREQKRELVELEKLNGGEWDNCNSIINKYIKKKTKTKKTKWTSVPLDLREQSK